MEKFNIEICDVCDFMTDTEKESLNKDHII